MVYVIEIYLFGVTSLIIDCDKSLISVQYKYVASQSDQCLIKLVFKALS